MVADRVVYLDSSAIVKLVVREPESQALRRYLPRRRALVSSALARVEVSRAVLPLGEEALRRAREVLASIDLVRINNRVLVRAGLLEPAELRSLDAIHLATAALFEDTLARFVCYDDRMLQAAQSLGWTVEAPT
jgi:predicted nucleic acid-binding protein